jgi:hypothetical protein
MRQAVPPSGMFMLRQNPIARLLIQVLLPVFLSTTPGNGQWAIDPYNGLSIGTGSFPEIARDGGGGAYVSSEVGVTYPVHLQLTRLNRYGSFAWSSARRIGGVNPESRYARTVSDDRGGVIIGFLDRLWNQNPGDPRYNDRVRVQRCDSSGIPLWGNEGVRATSDEHTQNGDYVPGVVADGQAGCIVVWEDSAGTLHANRIDSLGNRCWGDSGVAITNPGGAFQSVTDGMGGTIIAYDGPEVQRLDQSGRRLWGINGVGLGNISTMKMVDDGVGGAVLLGMRYVAYNAGDPLWAVVCNRVDSSGNLLWGGDGLTLQDSVQNLSLNPPSFVLTRNGWSHFTFVWGKRQNPNVIRLRIQMVSADGSVFLPAGGLEISTSLSRQIGYCVLPSDAGSSICVWADSRNPPGTYAQRMDTLGHKFWSANDILVSAPGYFQGGVGVSDGNGGLIMAGSFSPDFSVRVQQVNAAGQLGHVQSFVNTTNTEGEKFVVLQNYPNPFNPSTAISFSLPHAAVVSLKVYDMLGREVATLVEGREEAGEHSVTWNAEGFASGVYFCRLQANGVMLTRKLLPVR